MKSKIGWILTIILGLVVLFLLPSLMMGRFWGNGYNGMMGGYGGMMGGWGFMNPFGFLGMALMWLLPIGILVLLVYGAVSLFKGLNRSGNAPLVERKCTNCGKATQDNWSTCPYCGKAL
jgi:uncharacterized membrane protein